MNTAVLGSLRRDLVRSGTRLIAAISNVPAGGQRVCAGGSGIGKQRGAGIGRRHGGWRISGDGIQPAHLPHRARGRLSQSRYRYLGGDRKQSGTTIEILTFNLVLMNPSNVSLAGITYAGALAPVSSGSAPQLPSTKLPVPRFASSTVVVESPATATLSAAPEASPAIAERHLETLLTKRCAPFRRSRWRYSDF